MTAGPTVAGQDLFEKRYPSAMAAELAMSRSHAARLVGVRTPAVLRRIGRSTLGFERVVAATPPTKAQMVGAVQRLGGMAPDGLRRFDPFLRIRPRLGTAPEPIRAMVEKLEAFDTALRWPETAVIHGDFHPGQIIRDATGTVWLLDLDDLALGPREADLGNLAAWCATCSAGKLDNRAAVALTRILALSGGADPALAGHFCRVALVRRALKLAAKGMPWALDQLLLRA